MKKITFMISAISYGGAERVMSTLANALANMDYDVSIVMIVNRECLYPLSEKIRVCYLDSQEDRALPVWKRWPLRLKKIRRAIQELTPDVIVSFMAETNIDVCMAAAGLRVPIIVSERNDPTLDPPGRFKQWLRKLVYHRANGFVFQTPDARDYFAPWIRKKGTIILNPLTGTLPDIYEGPRDKRIVAVGRLNEQKNYPLLLEAFRSFSQVCPEYTLEIYGQGDLEEDLRKCIPEYGLTDRAKLMGYCSDVHAAIRGAAFFVMSSDFEGMPNALIEAMALGLPSICTDCPCGGPRMLIENNTNGLLVPVRDAAALCEAMKHMAANPEDAARMGQNAAEIRRRVNTDTIVDQWIQYAVSLVKSGNPRV